MHFDHVAALFLFEIYITIYQITLRASFEFLVRMITSLDEIDAFTAFILGFVMNMFISSSIDSVLKNI